MRMRKGITIVEIIFLLIIAGVVASIAYERLTGNVLITEEIVAPQHQKANGTTE